jgi:glycosyltransferase involved in cell wall biosynthesis
MSQEEWRLYRMNAPETDGRSLHAPVVSVAVTTFNSAKWLPRALDSVLMQRTSFAVEIVIGDDCSQDETVEVARGYQERHPGVIKILERPNNIGIQRNYYETFENCRGKYIAWLDADDYWTDPEKVAIQTDAFESDASVNVCCHFVRRVTVAGKVKRERYPSIAPGRYGLNEIIRHSFMATPSIMFRNGIHRDLPAWYFDFPNMTDWPILVIAALTGDIVLLDRTMADYMLTPGSAFESKGSLYWNEMNARFYELIESVLPAKWHRLVRAEKGKRYEDLAYLLRKQGSFTESRLAAVKAFRSPVLLDNIGSKTWAVLAAIVREAEWKIRGGKTRSAGTDENPR